MNYLKDFETNLREAGKGNRTIYEYCYTVQSFESWFTEGTGQTFDPDSITALDLHDWVAYMQTVARLAPATINKRVAAIKVYWTFLISRGYSVLNPSQKVKMKQISRLDQSPRWLSRKEQDKLLHIVHKEKNSWKLARNTAIIQAMLQSGLRISEVTALNVQDADLKRKTLTVVAGKGAKHRIVLMNPDLVKATREWLDIRGESDSPSLFLSARGRNRMTRQGVHYLIRKYLDSIGLHDDSAHALRHSFCRNLINAKQPLQVVAQLAGHESMETTRRYVTPSEQDLRQAVKSISSEK